MRKRAFGFEMRDLLRALVAAAEAGLIVRRITVGNGGATVETAPKSEWRDWPVDEKPEAVR
jgi:hypothetical protein